MFFTLSPRGAGEGLWMTFDYQGWWKATMSSCDGDMALCGRCELLSAPLNPGETLRIAPMTVGFYRGDYDDMGNAIQEYVYAYKWDYTRDKYFARTYDAEPPGQFLQAEQLGGGPYLWAVGTRDGQHLGAAARSDDDVLCRHAAHGMCIDEDALLANQGDVRMREQRLDAAAQRLNDLRLTLRCFSKRGGMHVRLRRDAANVEARTTHVDVLEDGDLQALLRRIDRSFVAAWPCSYND